MILVTGEPVAPALAEHGPFSRYIRDKIGDAWDGPYLDVDLRAGVELPGLTGASAPAGILITGSSASVTERADWILRGEAYLREAVSAKVPTFGICFGHQMLGSALGGEVQKNPAGREIGTVDVTTVADDPLFATVSPRAKVQTTHVDSVVRLPPGAQVLATTEKERHAALRFGELAWGVQYHPEFSGKVMRHYVAARHALLTSEGLDADGILGAIEETPGSAALLRSFARIAGERGR